MNADVIKSWAFLKRAIALLAYGYSALIIVYFLLRLIFWDQFWVVGLVSSFIPLILLPILILPVLALGMIKKRWFSIASSIACILLISWLHLKYFSPHPIQATSSQLNIKVLSLNCSWYKTSSENLTSLIPNPTY